MSLIAIYQQQSFGDSANSTAFIDGVLPTEGILLHPYAGGVGGASRARVEVWQDPIRSVSANLALARRTKLFIFTATVEKAG